MQCKTCSEDFTPPPSKPSAKECGACKYERRKVPCIGCGELKRRQSAVCGSCYDPQDPTMNPTTKGVHADQRGYVRRYVPQGTHPRALKSKYVLEHVLVMEAKIGRYLEPGENVHHVNGVRGDNRPENLELWVSSQPSGQRAKDLVSWAKDILEKYEDLVDKL